MAQSLLGLKMAYEKAAKDGKPNADAIAPRSRALEFEGPAGHVKMALGDGHQGITETAYGTYRFNKQKQAPEIVDIIRYPAECVRSAAGRGSRKWIADGMKAPSATDAPALGRRSTRRGEVSSHSPPLRALQSNGCAVLLTLSAI